MKRLAAYGIKEASIMPGLITNAFYLPIFSNLRLSKLPDNRAKRQMIFCNIENDPLYTLITRSILPVKKGMRTCELALSPVSFSLPTCECVAKKERRAQLLLVNVFLKLVPVLCMSGTLTQPLCQHRKSKQFAREK